MRPRTAVFTAVSSLACIGPFACWFAVHAQQPPDLQIVETFHRISRHAGQLPPMLEQVRVQEWVAKGAPETYAAQLDSAQKQIQAIQTDLANLAQHPEHMQDCIRGLFRIQAFHRSLDSLMGGLRKYQNPALADLIQAVAAEDQSDLDQLQTYILELANQKEQEYQVVDREAQRCRAIISRQPATQTKTAPRTNP